MEAKISSKKEKDKKRQTKKDKKKQIKTYPKTLFDQEGNKNNRRRRKYEVLKNI